MIRPLPLDHDRIMDLLAMEATEGLSPSETVELNQFFAANPQFDRDGLMIAAAATDLALLSDDECHALPAHLQAKLVSGAAVSPPSPSREAIIAMSQPAHAAATRYAWMGWVAAAAALLFAAWSWYRPQPTPVVPVTRTTAEQLATLEKNATDVVRAAWTAGVDEFAGVSGEVVWSDAQQTGFMIFEGLTPNTPTEKQYQLWIVDPDRDKHPVDGGVFDVATRGKIIVPIHAKLAVDDPAVFALTVEKPGGVVVSAGPLVLVAKISSS
ncbi:MAG: anti-sigma factor [Phycisphaerae bacterium]